MKRTVWIAALLLVLTASAQQPVNQGQTARSSGNLTATAAASSSCGATSCVTVSTSGYAVATVSVHGTYGSSTINFEFSDDGGTTYYPELCSETAASAQESNKSGTNASTAWDCGVYAATNFEVRQSAISSGTAVVNITLSAAGIEPAPSVGLVAGTAVIGKVGIDQTTPGTTNATEVTASTDSSIGLSSSSKATVTSSVNVKASAGNVYGVFFLNGAVSGCWIELINSSGAGTLGSAVITNIPMASGGTQLLTFSPPIGGFTSGIAVGSASASGGSSACGTAATGITILYK